MQPSESSARTSTLLCCAALSAIAIARLWPLVECIGGCLVDFEGLRGPDAFSVHLDTADTNLNSWILAWVQHALVSNPGGLFDANIFHPAKATLTASEHMLGVAVPLLPLGLAGAGAQALHQTALLASFVLTAITTFLLVRWLTGAAWVAFVSGVVAIVMPWRVAELSHLQLLSSQWIPLIWLLTARLFLEPATPTRAFWLFLVLSIQLLSSFYLAYFVTLSLPVFCLSLWIGRRPSPRTLGLVSAAIAGALLLLVAVSLPYLASGIGIDLTTKGDAVESIGFARAWLHLVPQHLFAWPLATPLAIGYSLPSAVAVLAMAGLPFLIAGTPSEAAQESRSATEWALEEPPTHARTVGLGLWMVVLFAFLMSLGRYASIAGSDIALPAQWAASVIPGFDNLRAPLRWGILIGLAAPVLAGLTLWRLDTRLKGMGILGRGGAGRGLFFVIVSGAVLATCLWVPVPTLRVAQDDAAAADPYRALAELPDGPVAEIPWPLQADYDATLAARYMVAGSKHWQPLLNGYSAYVPHSYDYLRRLAKDLPAAGAVENLKRMAGLKYFMIHTDKLTPTKLAAWDQAVFAGTLVSLYEDENARIYAIADGAGEGLWIGELLSRVSRPTTFAGLSRESLHLEPKAGRLWIRIPKVIDLFEDDWMKTSFALTIENSSRIPWPGLDIQTEGLVEARYTFVDDGGRVAAQGTSPLDADMPAGEATTTGTIAQGHLPAGRYTLRVDLVQRQGDELHTLPVTSAESAVTLVGRGRGS